MPTREGSWPDGTPCWIDLAVPDVDAARQFYQSLFGWSIQDGPPEAGGYLIALKNGQAAAGIGPKMVPDTATAWTVYLATSDARASAERITANGGQILAEPIDVMGLGEMAFSLDPAGATFGLWQAGSYPGVTIFNEPGTFIWAECLSGSLEQLTAFYGAVFGWDFNDMSGDNFKYATFVVGGRDVGGLGEYGADQAQSAPQWSTYFAVQDTDAAVEQVVQLGGNVLQPARDTPYGRMATVTDDQGAVFAVMSAPAEGYAE
jgi:predicted enzyme related to lactoylglutathione lyase